LHIATKGTINLVKVKGKKGKLKGKSCPLYLDYESCIVQDDVEYYQFGEVRKNICNLFYHSLKANRSNLPITTLILEVFFIFHICKTMPIVIAQFVLVPKRKAKGGKIGVTGGCPITFTLIRHLFLFRDDS